MNPDPATPAAPGALAALSGRTFDAVLFDLDGTLIDSTPAVLRAWGRWAAEWGIDRPDIPHGVPARQVLVHLVTEERIEAAFVRIEEIEAAELSGIVALPGAVEALQALPGDRCAIVTSGTRPLARARIEATGLPAPALLVTPEDVPLAGLTSGRAAGCATLALTTSHPADELNALGPDAVVGSLAQVRFAVRDGLIRLSGPSGGGSDPGSG